MVVTQSKTYCDRCKIEFFHENSADALYHSNKTSGHNLGVMNAGHDMIRYLDLRKDNFCNIVDVTLQQQKEVINCALLWLRDSPGVDPGTGQSVREFFEQRDERARFVFANSEGDVDILRNRWAYTNRILDETKDWEVVKIKRLPKLISNNRMSLFEISGSGETFYLTI